MDYYVREARKNYELFMQEKNNNYLKELAKIFSIELDETRLSDYSIINYCFKASGSSLPTISIYDNKEKTTFTSELTSVADLINIFGGGYYTSVNSSSKLGTITKNFYIGETQPIAEKLEINYGDYSLVFEREKLDEIYTNTPYDNKFCVTYYGKDKNDDKLFDKCYLSRVTADYCSYYERKNGQEILARKNNYDCPNHYIHYYNGNVIYVIQSQYNRSISKCECSGVFIEDTCDLCKNRSHFESVFPSGWYTEKLNYLYNPEIKSCLIFQPWTGNEEDKRYFEIYKINDKLIIKCITKSWDAIEYWKDNTKEHELPIISKGRITAEEIRYLVNYLQPMYNDIITDGLFYNELLKYADMLDNRETLILEETDPLSPKRLINTSFEEILEEIGNNKDKYFDLAQKEFEEMAYGEVKKPIIKALKPSNN